MDWQNPLRSIAPTVDADVLQVLARTHEPVTGNKLAQLAGRSYAQVHAVVGRLVDHGIVDVRQVGRTYAYNLNRRSEERRQGEDCRSRVSPKQSNK